MALPDFDIPFRLASPTSRTPRTTEEELRAAFPDESRIRFLGAGSFGDTWRVEDTAVKVIVADSFDEARVAREIAAASVASQNVVSLKGTTSLFAAGEDQGRARFRIRQRRRPRDPNRNRRRAPQDDLRELAVGLLGGLHGIRSAGVIHLDIKPENVQLRIGAADSKLRTRETAPGTSVS
jgi:serine/threonine protein kinase